jgi:hypothetical protein
MSAKKKAKPTRGADEALVTDCVLFVRWLAANEAGINADPSGNSEVANKLPNLWRKSRKALARIAGTKATTTSGLQAKARIVPYIIPDNLSCLNDDEFEFLRSFATDVSTFLERLTHAEWLEALKDRERPPSSRVTLAPALPRNVTACSLLTGLTWGPLQRSFSLAPGTIAPCRELALKTAEAHGPHRSPLPEEAPETVATTGASLCISHCGTLGLRRWVTVRRKV